MVRPSAATVPTAEREPVVPGSTEALAGVRVSGRAVDTLGHRQSSRGVTDGIFRGKIIPDDQNTFTKITYSDSVVSRPPLGCGTENLRVLRMFQNEDISRHDSSMTKDLPASAWSLPTIRAPPMFLEKDPLSQAPANSLPPL